MSDGGDGRATQDEKAARLAAALRANLRRRKQQARATPPPAGEGGSDQGLDQT